MKNSYLPNEALFTATDYEGAEDLARDYIKEHSYTKEDVKLVRREGLIQVITIREILWGEK